MNGKSIYRVLISLISLGMLLVGGLAVASPANSPLGGTFTSLTYVCSGTPVPAGWIVSEVRQNPSKCGANLEWGMYSPPSSASKVTACEFSPVPDIWLVESVNTSAYTTCSPYRQMGLVRITPSMTTWNVCDGFPLPIGWIYDYTAGGSSCGPYITMSARLLQSYETQAIACESTTVPPNWVITAVAIGTCAPYRNETIRKVQTYDSQIAVCESSPQLPGWVISSVGSSSSCGPYRGEVISKIQSYQNMLQVCANTNLPPGWIVTGSAVNTNVCGPYLVYTIVKS